MESEPVERFIEVKHNLIYSNDLNKRRGLLFNFRRSNGALIGEGALIREGALI